MYVIQLSVTTTKCSCTELSHLFYDLYLALRCIFFVGQLFERPSRQAGGFWPPQTPATPLLQAMLQSDTSFSELYELDDAICLTCLLSTDHLITFSMQEKKKEKETKNLNLHFLLDQKLSWKVNILGRKIKIFPLKNLQKIQGKWMHGCAWLLVAAVWVGVAVFWGGNIL